jgi:ABC-type methionine transport system ATPase subunit
MIAIDDLHKSYRTADGRLSAVLKGLSLQVPERSITAVVGPSGAGKSTLARCISLLEQPDSGSIRINGQDLSALSGEALRRERRAIGTVFQSSALLSRRTAWENVALPLAWLGVVERDIKARVGELLESVGLSHKADAWPAQLSGGQRQRIGIARALALRPSVLLADEATSGLDPQATASVLTLLKRLRELLGVDPTAVPPAPRNRSIQPRPHSDRQPDARPAVPPVSAMPRQHIALHPAAAPGAGPARHAHRPDPAPARH